ncbi:hypothetical protein JOQ06_028383, partial [Pogonophryne albipinna]
MQPAPSARPPRSPLLLMPEPTALETASASTLADCLSPVPEELPLKGVSLEKHHKSGFSSAQTHLGADRTTEDREEDTARGRGSETLNCGMMGRRTMEQQAALGMARTLPAALRCCNDSLSANSRVPKPFPFSLLTSSFCLVTVGNQGENKTKQILRAV